MSSNTTDQTLPAKGQIWEHILTAQQLLVLSINDDNEALCALLDKDNDNAVTKLRVVVPCFKLKFRSNRGFALIGQRKGKLPAAGPGPYGAYNARRVLFGAR